MSKIWGGERVDNPTNETNIVMKVVYMDTKIEYSILNNVVYNKK